MKALLITLLSAILLTSCASQSDVLPKIKQGMTYKEFRKVLTSEPANSEMLQYGMIYKYNLHKPFVGNQPFYFAFNNEGELVSYYMDKNEYNNSQARGLAIAGQMQQQNISDKQLKLERAKLLQQGNNKQVVCKRGIGFQKGSIVCQ